MSKVENVLFVLFNPIIALKVTAKRLDLAIRLQDDFTASMSMFRAAVYFGFAQDPWPKSAHDKSGELAPKMGEVALPQE